MGHRANFVVIRDAQATAYTDNWAAMGCICGLEDGPEPACERLAKFEKTAELMEWCWAEGGFLIDYDEHKLIVFGPTVDLGELADEEGNLDQKLRKEYEPFTQTGLPYLRHISKRWCGWKLIWDDHGVDAFAAHLRNRGISSITTQPDSHPNTTEPPVELQA